MQSANQTSNISWPATQRRVKLIGHYLGGAPDIEIARKGLPVIQVRNPRNKMRAATGTEANWSMRCPYEDHLKTSAGIPSRCKAFRGQLWCQVPAHERFQAVRVCGEHEERSLSALLQVFELRIVASFHSTELMQLPTNGMQPCV